MAIGRQRELQTAISVVTKEYNKMISALDKYPEDLQQRLITVGKRVIGDWYDSYPLRTKYRRQRSLMDVFKVKYNKKKKTFTVSFDSDYIEAQHRVDNEYIYDNSFVGGYHGGADSISEALVQKGKRPHPDPGTPYWRKPTPRFTYWGVPAVQTFSPRDRMIEEMQVEIDNAEGELADKIHSSMNRIMRTINAYLR